MGRDETQKQKLPRGRIIAAKYAFFVSGQVIYVAMSYYRYRKSAFRYISRRDYVVLRCFVLQVNFFSGWRVLFFIICWYL